MKMVEVNNVLSRDLEAPMRVLQVLPALNSGGVERGTVDMARELMCRGHESLVMSTGGPMVKQLEAEGSVHITMPVARKSLWSLRHVRSLRRCLVQLAPDVVHVRSRLPAWLIWLAWRGLPVTQRPRLVTTFHGLYSRNAYSAIMGRGERVIAISQTVHKYIVDSYPNVDPNHIRLIHRGVDRYQFSSASKPSPEWFERLYGQHPELRGKRLVMMPGRLTRWKGQIEFLGMMAALKRMNVDCHGIIVGGAEPDKEDYQEELRQAIRVFGLSDHISLLGKRSDMQELYSASALVCNLSQSPEPFGRTVIEALASGVPVLARNQGGPAEVLKRCFPQGLVDGHKPEQWAEVAKGLLEGVGVHELAYEFTLDNQVEKTLAVYRELLDQPISQSLVKTRRSCALRMEQAPHG
ncbi:glycosyltransferase [Pseudomaricurvus sp.]|uniref:glycosyltransferase n=1 Tax=Pseudomaricurvus sp. TaxID=2004510 RepID=UPI003F6BDDAF